MASEKTPVIEHLWDMLLAEGKGRRVVYSDDVVAAIIHCNAAMKLGLSTKNTANFMKDVVRGDNANDFWPPALTSIRIGARQRPGSTRIFEFVDFEPSQTEPFPNRYMPQPGMVAAPIQSVSLSLAMRQLGRKDESWLIQVAVELRIIQMHLASHSKLPIEEAAHLQTGVKLSSSEVDALFLGHLKKPDGGYSRILITCEAKQEGQRILEHQMIEQVVAASRSVRGAGLDIEAVMPVAIKALPGSKIYVVEFEPWSISDTELPEDKLPGLTLASEGLYELRPPIRGIGFTPKKPRKLP